MLITINKLLHLFQIQENIEFKIHFFVTKCFNTEEDMTIFLLTNVRYPYLLTVSFIKRAEVEGHTNDTFFCKQQLKTHTKSKHYILLKERSKRFLRAMFFFFFLS